MTASRQKAGTLLAPSKISSRSLKMARFTIATTSESDLGSVDLRLSPVSESWGEQRESRDRPFVHKKKHRRDLPKTTKNLPRGFSFGGHLGKRSEGGVGGGGEWPCRHRPFRGSHRRIGMILSFFSVYCNFMGSFNEARCSFTPEA